MPRKSLPLGPETLGLLEEARTDLLHALLGEREDENEPVIALPQDVPLPEDDAAVDAYRQNITESLSQFTRDELRPVEQRSRRVRMLARGKGIVSLETIVERQLDDEAIREFERQPDHLCRSIWTFLNARETFENAESFHFARQFRDHGKLYDAFEVDLENAESLDAAAVDETALAEKARQVLELRSEISCTVKAIDLPQTDAHPASIMVIVRHGGPLSSVFHLRDDGRSRAMYYRPPNEVTLIYTPSLRQIEVCADNPVARQRVGDAFAQIVLHHDISSKPLTWKRYNLTRFRSSLRLDLPMIDGYTISRVRVLEAEVRLGNWRRKLLLKVTIDDDIEEVANQYLGPQNVYRRPAAFSKITIAVAYTRAGDTKKRTLNITISGTKSCNLQSHKDPEERSLGFALLKEWGILHAFRQIDIDDLRGMFAALLQLHEGVENEVSGQQLCELGLDPQQLIEGGLLERRDRQDVILIDDCDIEGEGSVEPSKKAGMVKITGPFGEDAGERPASDHDMYAINAAWLHETLMSLLKPLLSKRAVEVLDTDLTRLGAMQIGETEVPIYLGRRLDDLKTVERLDILMRARNQAGVGIVLTASQAKPAYLGPNVIASLLENLAPESEDLVLSRDGLELAWRGGRELAGGGEVPRVLKSGPQSATLHVPGKPPLVLTGADQIRIFERLVAAVLAGSPDVQVKTLMEGTGSRSPQQAFRAPTWRNIKDVYIGPGQKRGYWRLITANAAPVVAV